MFQRDILADDDERNGAQDTIPHTDALVITRHEIRGEGRYSAVLEDLGFMWRWKIFRDGEVCQDGCSLSERSSREAVSHVLAFYQIRDENNAAGAN